MTRIPDNDRDLMEKAIYYPMVIKVLMRDLIVVKNAPFKIQSPYLMMIEETLKTVQKELSEVKREMKKQGYRVAEVGRDQDFTTFLFVYKGFEEYHNYFNPRLRNKVEELLRYYFYERYQSNLYKKEIR
jgi:hypothetical protein